MTNCLQLLFIWKWLHLLFFLKDSFAWYSSLGWQFFQHFELYHPTFSWPARFLLRNPLIVLLVVQCVCGGVPLYVMSHYFLRSSQNSPFCLWFWQLSCNVSWCRPLCVQSIWGPTAFMNLDIHFTFQIWKVLNLLFL